MADKQFNNCTFTTFHYYSINLDQDRPTMKNISLFNAHLNRIFCIFIFALTTSQISASELKIDILKVGAGTQAENGMQISVHYEGRLSDGTVFDSSKPRGAPFSFVLGAGKVIKGWDTGILGMRPGEKRVLTIPPELGYGARGAGSAIPPNATLIFNVEMLEMTWPTKLQAASNQDLKKSLQSGAVLIDIRRPEEWQETGIIGGAELVTAFTKSGKLHPEFQQKFMSLITDRDAPIMLYCRTGNRTTNLGNALVQQLGFSNVSHLSAGITGWQKDNLPVALYKP
jgi:rhodanese-related sulfurtransferase